MITFVTSWYIVKAKFNKELYAQWINNLLANVNNFNLVIFTNEESKYMIEPYLKNKKIKAIIYEWDEFSTYKYKDKWVSNHEINHSLNNMVHWKLNMLWNEKINMVKIVKDRLIFPNNIFGWCDIGYFRCNSASIDFDTIRQWPNEDKINSIDKHKIYYNQVCNSYYLNNLVRHILTKNDTDLPVTPIPYNQVSIAGGFFLTHCENINWWWNTFYKRLELYFDNNYLVKDDQIIVIDCIANNLKHFKLIKQQPGFDPWFGFQTYLL